MVKGKLYIVSTPIGNLEDVTYRAVRILKEVDLILAEDTRITSRLCDRYQITTPLLSFHARNTHMRLFGVLERLLSGENLALVSDAGTPGISDPGTPLVRKAIEEGIEVIPLPGASSVLTALAGSGFDGNSFVFEGFLPRKTGARKKILQRMVAYERTTLFFESPHRLATTLADLVDVLGEEQPVLVARELTKKFESWYRGTAQELAARFAGDSSIKGEIVIVVPALHREISSEQQLENLLINAMANGEGIREASRAVAQQTGISASVLYRMALVLDEKGSFI
ncbi:MAG: 16S rRNA (cytidine(1402)-2'-O)-methyltransferase [Magnetococcus sp. DMHC-6]